MSQSPAQPAEPSELRATWRRLRSEPLVAAIAAGVAVFAVSLALWRPVPVGSSQDDGLYVILAKSLATGHGYRFINLPDAPQAVHYPPGYPALLAILWTMWPSFPANIVLFVVANFVLLGIAASGATMVAHRTGIPPGLALATAAVGFLMPPMLALMTTLISEPLWLALAFPWLLWAERVARPEHHRSTSWPTVTALGATAGALILVRTQSVSLLAGVVVVLAARRRWRDAAIVFASTAVVMLPWQLWVTRYAALIPEALSGKYGAYGAWVGEGVRVRGSRLFSEALLRNGSAALHLVRGMFSIPRLPAAVAVVTLMPPFVMGAMRLARRSPVLLATLCAHAAMILFFPGETQRYVWGSWPFIAIWIAAGFVEMWERQTHATPTDVHTIPSRTSISGSIRVLTLADIAFVTAGAAISTLTSVTTGSFRNYASFGARQLEPSVQWVQHRVPPSTIIASDDETAVYLYTGRRTVPLSVPLSSAYVGHVTPSPVPLEMILARYDPDLVIARWQASVSAALRLSQGASPLLQPIATLQAGAVFARLRPASP